MRTHNTMLPSIRLLCVFSVVLAFALTVYSLGLPGFFIFDDIPAIVANPSLRAPLTVFDEWRVLALSSESGPWVVLLQCLVLALAQSLAALIRRGLS